MKKTRRTCSQRKKKKEKNEKSKEKKEVRTILFFETRRETLKQETTQRVCWFDENPYFASGGG